MTTQTVVQRGMRIGELAAATSLSPDTIRYYENHIDPALADEIWQEGDREHA